MEKLVQLARRAHQDQLPRVVDLPVLQPLAALLHQLAWAALVELLVLLLHPQARVLAARLVELQVSLVALKNPVDRVQLVVVPVDKVVLVQPLPLVNKVVLGLKLVAQVLVGDKAALVGPNLAVLGLVQVQITLLDLPIQKPIWAHQLLLLVVVKRREMKLVEWLQVLMKRTLHKSVLMLNMIKNRLGLQTS